MKRGTTITPAGGTESRSSMGQELPRFARDLLAAPPRAGEGVNSWLFRVARVLHAFRSPREITAILEAAVFECGRSVPAREIERAVKNSLPVAWQPGGHVSKPAPAWPIVNQKRRAAIVAEYGLMDLWELSPVRYGDDTPHTETIVDTLFPGNPLLCVGASNSNFKTRSRESLRGELSTKALIVPSSMNAKTGWTKDDPPKLSEHTFENTGPRRFLVVEFDQGEADEHAALLLHLAGRAPLALAVHSGNRSLHGWFYCHDQNERRLKHFMAYAVSLGADKATWTRSQFVRMPDGRRDNGKRQTVFFFNPRCVPR